MPVEGCEKECHLPDIAEPIAAYLDQQANSIHHRYRSWEHCYKYFHEAGARNTAAENPYDASLQLAAYLSSWGMYRGSG